MTIRAHLLLSYLGLILVLTLGIWLVAESLLEKVSVERARFSEEGLLTLTYTNYQLTEEVLTSIGRLVVKDKAEDVARELGHLFRGQKTFDYAKMRRDPQLRKIAIQTINSLTGAAGYTDLYDNKGFMIFHPDPKVEGKYQQDFGNDYPEVTAMIKRSFTENYVSGTFTFFDKDNKERRRYAVRVHVPGTPLIVGAIVNIDEFFQPTQERIRKASQAIIAQGREAVRQHNEKITRQLRGWGLAGGAAFFGLACVFAFVLASSLSRPLRRLRDGVRQIGEGDFTVAVPTKGAKEIVHLAESFNHLGHQLTEYIEKRDFIRDTFGRYVTQEVAKRLLESKDGLELGGEKREVSMLMSDLRGFTAITAAMDPEAVITFLNRYLERMIDILIHHRAVIDEIMGDGILAFFGAPESMEDHPARAVACALAMQAAMAEINAANAADGLPLLEMGVAVNTGTVVVGNVGSEKRTKYSIIGSAVNVTSRMEGFSVGGQVLVGEDAYRRVSDMVEVGEVYTVQMKGVPEAATLYEVVAIGGPFPVRLPARRTGLTPLAAPVPVRLQILKGKVMRDPLPASAITALSETAARLTGEGEVQPWQDVSLSFLDDQGQEHPAALYGKVVAAETVADRRFTATVRFTFVSPPALEQLHRHLGGC